jgi:hypothetical protein
MRSGPVSLACVLSRRISDVARILLHGFSTLVLSRHAE